MSTASSVTGIDVARADSPRHGWTSGPAIVCWIAALKFLLQWALAGRYGYFGDEFYLLACGAHPAWGYVDHPPFTPMLAWLLIHTVGTSLWAIRFLPALAGALQICVLGAITRRLGGGRFAQLLVAVAALATPAYLGFQHYLHIVAFEPLFWSLLAYFLLRALECNQTRYWMAAGAVAGVGLQNKYTMAIFILGLLAGLMLDHARRLLRTVDFWAAGLLAFVIFLPNLLWLYIHDFPFLRWHRSVAVDQALYSTFPHFWRDQLTLTFPAAPVLLCGLWFFLVQKPARPFRFLGVAAMFVFAFFSLQHAKSYYSAPVFGILYAGGAVLLEEYTQAAGRRRDRRTLIVAISVAGLVLAPCFLPILPIRWVARYQKVLPLLPYYPERYMQETATPLFSWEFGGQEVVAAVANIYRSLPDADKPRVGIMSDYYGSAGAVDLLGGKYGLPKSMCSHMSYKDWGPGAYHGDILIVIGFRSPEALRHLCREMRPGPFVNNPYGYHFQRGQVVNLCIGGLAQDLPQRWEGLNQY